jgi:hypothetical protein
VHKNFKAEEEQGPQKKKTPKHHPILKLPSPTIQALKRYSKPKKKKQKIDKTSGEYQRKYFFKETKD